MPDGKFLCLGWEVGRIKGWLILQREGKALEISVLSYFLCTAGKACPKLACIQIPMICLSFSIEGSLSPAS